MYGILRNGTKLLCYAGGKRKSYFDTKTGNIRYRSIWDDVDECLDPYKWNVNSRMIDLQKIYRDDDLELFEFTKERLEDLSFRRLRGY